MGSYRVMALFLSLMLILGIGAMFVPPKPAPPGNADHLSDDNSSAAWPFLLELSEGMELTPSQARLILPALRKRLDHARPLARLKQKLVTALDREQKEYLNAHQDKIERVLSCHFPSFRNLAGAVAECLKKTKPDKTAQKGGYSYSNVPGWPRQQPSLDEILAGVLVLDNSGKLRPAQRRYIADKIEQYRKPPGLKPLEEKDFAVVFRGVLSREQLRFAVSRKTPGGVDFLLDYGGDLQRFVLNRAGGSGEGMDENWP